MRNTFHSTHNALIVVFIVFFLLWIPGRLNSQKTEEPTSQQFIFAQELYLDGEFEHAFKVLESLVQHSEETNSSILYLKIMCLHELYEHNNHKARELEYALSKYFNQHSIGNTLQYEYENVVAVQLDFSVFRAKDDKAFNELSGSLSGNDTLKYQTRIQAINSYNNYNLHSYHRDSLTHYSQVFSDSLSKKLDEFDQQLFNKQCLERIDRVGKFSTLEIGINYCHYGIDSKTISDFSDIEPFLSQNESRHSSSKPAQSFDISALNIGFNLPHTNRWKASILYSVFTFGLQTWELENDTTIIRPHNRGGANNLVSISLGTKIGLMNSFLITPKTRVGLYYNFNPALSYFNETYSFTNNEPRQMYIVSKKENLIIRHELGLRFYVSDSAYLGICYQLGNYGWRTSISTDSEGNEGEELESIIPYQHIGIRIGF